MATYSPSVPSTTVPRAEADAVADVVRRAIEPQVHKVDGEGVRVLAVGPDTRIVSLKAHLDEYASAPDRREGRARLTTLESFIAHANRFKDEDSAVYADDTPEKPSLTSVLDYHRAGADGLPRFGRHRGVYAFPLSDEWKAWTSLEGKLVSQDSFAAFLEERVIDIVDPSTALATAKTLTETLGADFAGPARMLELSRGLAVNVGARIAKFINLGSGESQITYAESHTDGQGAPLRVPGLFLVQIPIFVAGHLYQLSVRLRYRTVDGNVRWIFEIVRRAAYLRDAVSEAAKQAQTETALPLFFGRPERATKAEPPEDC